MEGTVVVVVLVVVVVVVVVVLGVVVLVAAEVVVVVLVLWGRQDANLSRNERPAERLGNGRYLERERER